MEPLILSNTTQSLQIVLDGTPSTEFPFVCSYADNNGTTFTEGVTTGVTTNTSPVTVAAAPASTYRRIIKSLSVKNAGNSTKVLTITYNDNTNLRNIVVVTLTAGDGWTMDGTYDSTGAIKQVTALPQVIVAAGKVLTVNKTMTLTSAGDSGVITLPNATDTVMGLATTDSVTGAKTFDSSALKMKGSSTGVTTVASANAGASNYTQTLPAATGTVALVTGTSDTITVGSIELGAATDTTIARVSAGVASIEGANIMTVSSTDTVTGTKTMSAITLPSNGQISLTAPTTDGHTTGNVTSSFNSGYSSSAVGDLVYLDASATWQKTDADSTTTAYGLIGIALEVKSSGQALKVALPGSFVRVDAWNWTVGNTLYLGETTGAMQNAIPTGADNVIRVVGFAVNADYIYFYPSQDVSTTIN